MKLTKENKISIFPNPAKEKITIKTNFKEHYHVNIYSFSGKLVSSHKEIMSKKYTINTSELNSGIYFIQVISQKGKIFTKKIIVLD